MDSVTLRLVEPKDSEFIWQIRNGFEVRQASLQSAEIPWKDHQDWFQMVLRKAPYSQPFYVICAYGAEIGYLRLTFAGSRVCEVSIALHPSQRNRGVGTEAIKLGVAAALEKGARTICARIRPGNEPSRRAFAKAGFRAVYQVWEYDGA